MTTTTGTDAILRGTGTSWDEWLEYSDQIGAATLSHADIARKISEDGRAGGWWSQMMTVQYDLHIGRRVPGQDCDGAYSISVNRTFAGDMDSVLAWCVELTGGRTEFCDIAVTRGPMVTETPKWRYWRCGLADGSRVNINVSAKGTGKATLSIQHERLESADQAEHWRAYWKQVLREAAV